jgi:hypothetical protein
MGVWGLRPQPGVRTPAPRFHLPCSLFKWYEKRQQARFQILKMQLPLLKA